jgi:ribosomal protein L3 glutamine methyltransferase
MNTDALRLRLERARSYDEWVDALGAYFLAGGCFFGHGTDNAEDEAFWLIRHLHGWNDALWDAVPDPGLIGTVLDIARRRVAERVPLAYLLGEAWFAGLPFSVDRSVLVPRSPLAELIERCFAPWVALAPGDRLLDVGTGSGCLAVAAAHYCDGVQVDATDASAAALAVAARNAERHGVGGRVHLHRADLFPGAGGPYRVIMSNPPYLPAGAVETLPQEYRAEPVLGLVGGPTGVEPAERLIQGARPRLTADGVLVVEVGAEAETLMARHPQLPAVWLELERGGEGVFVLTAEQLDTYLVD